MAHSNSSTNVVTRYAPSPTGFQHIGGIRTALFAWLWARKNNGTFILRIEDTDKDREVAGAIEHTINALSWMGIEYDYGPDKPGPFGSCIQSQRLDIYRSYAQKLVAKGLAYPDPYTAAELDAFRAQADAEKRPFLYRHHRPTTTTSWDGTQALRLKTPNIKRYEWHDVVRGPLSAGEEMLDDVILIKADGYPTYNFAHIVDDLEMNVTHVMRGEEFISSTPKFLSIYDALEVPWPQLVTLPPILGPDGKKKLSKRDGAKDILEYRTDGYLPEVMRNFLALVGWNPGGEVELFPGDDLVNAFSLEKIQRSGGAFNEEKLKWMNHEYLKRIGDDEAGVTFKINYIGTALPKSVKELPQYSQERVTRLAPVIFERVHTQNEINAAATAGEYDYAFTTPDYDVQILKWKNDTSVTDAKPRLEHVIELLRSADFSSPKTIKTTLWSYADSVGRGEVLWPLRVALSGRTQSPDPFTLAYMIGPEESQARILAACDKISQCQES